MEYTFQDLKHKKVAELREIAAGIDNEAVKGCFSIHSIPPNRNSFISICRTNQKLWEKTDFHYPMEIVNEEPVNGENTNTSEAQFEKTLKF